MIQPPTMETGNGLPLLALIASHSSVFLIHGNRPKILILTQNISKNGFLN
jgi:hypothetical protein